MQPVEAFTQADCSAESPFPIQASLLNQKPVSPPPATFVRSNQKGLWDKKWEGILLNHYILLSLWEKEILNCEFVFDQTYFLQVVCPCLFLGSEISNFRLWQWSPCPSRPSWAYYFCQMTARAGSHCWSQWPPEHWCTSSMNLGYFWTPEHWWTLLNIAEHRQTQTLQRWTEEHKKSADFLRFSWFLTTLSLIPLCILSIASMWIVDKTDWAIVYIYIFLMTHMTALLHLIWVQTSVVLILYWFQWFCIG